MKEPKSTSRATLDHPAAATGRDGAIDFAATVEAASAERVMLDMPPHELEAIDAWIRTQPAPRPSRADAIRRLVKQALTGVQAPQQRGKEAASKAREMAGREIDRLGDASLPADERERRKRRLTKGPTEFREMRGDLPKPKR
jgi:ribosomal protein S11